MFYQSPQTNWQLWQGRSDVPHFPERWHQVIRPWDLQAPHQPPSRGRKPTDLRPWALIGFASDCGVRRNFGRAGAALGPRALRQALAPLVLSEPSLELWDCGDIIPIEDRLEEASACLAASVAQICQAGLTPLVLGGGHETAWGHYQGLLSGLGFAPGIVNIDAHLDLRPLSAEGQKPHSGSPFLQIAENLERRGQEFDYVCLGLQPGACTANLRQTAERLQVRQRTALELQSSPTAIDASCQALIRPGRPIYLTLCLDALAEAFAPGVSAPQALGLLPSEFLRLIDRITDIAPVVAVDIVELAPPHDRGDQTARLAAALVNHAVTRLSQDPKRSG